jgi:hypothetical protein
MTYKYKHDRCFEIIDPKPERNAPVSQHVKACIRCFVTDYLFLNCHEDMSQLL